MIATTDVVAAGASIQAVASPPATRLDCNIHNAQPSVHRSGSLIWITVPITPSEPTNTITFFIAPALATVVGESLTREAATAVHLEAIEAAASAAKRQNDPRLDT